MGIIILKVPMTQNFMFFFVIFNEHKKYKYFVLFQVKEIAPDQIAVSRFWNKDIREVRRFNRHKKLEANQTHENLILQ